ncbi:MAG TPA: hypothetical protein VFW59_03355 [Gallionella sp.]|nr:hypothetical protein [Gallionella sp.]
MTDHSSEFHADNAKAARTLKAVVRLAKHLKIDLSDESLRNAFIAQAAIDLKAAKRRHLSLPAWERITALYPIRPGITPRYTQIALNTYQEIDALPMSPE